MVRAINKLIAIQNELKAPKNQRNNFGNYNYRNVEDILEAVKPLLLKHECTLTITDDVVEIGGSVYVKATATIYADLGETQDIISGVESVKYSTLEVSAFARESLDQKGMAPAQMTGSASSYARKYALNGLFLIDDTKDADFNNTHDVVSSTKKQEKPVTEHPRRVVEESNDYNEDQGNEERYIPSDDEVVCSVCGGIVEHKSGISKAGNEYNMYKCTQCDNVDWINN